MTELIEDFQVYTFLFRDRSWEHIEELSNCEFSCVEELFHDTGELNDSLRYDLYFGGSCSSSEYLWIAIKKLSYFFDGVKA